MFIYSTEKKPTIKVGFCDTFITAAEYFYFVLSHRYNVVLDNENPQFLFFGDRNFGQNNLKYNNKGCIKIFYTGENQRYTDYSCHFGIGYDYINDSNYYRLPLYVIYEWENIYKNKIGSIFDLEKKKEDLKNRTKFCSFIVSNPNSPKRNEFFHKLNEYKKVDSGGPLFNNIGYIIPRENGAFRKREFLKQYKFNLCFENSSYSGHVTEKIFEGFWGGIPIYWGSEKVRNDFNSESFLNWHEYENDDKLIERIIELDKDNDKYLEVYLKSPINYNNKVFDFNNFLNWFGENVYKKQ